jgi:hypothetical protein
MLMPLQCGGGPDEPTKAYLVLRSAVGVGGSAPDDSGIDGLWRRSRALGLAAGTSATRRAFCNAFPFLATDLLPHYERSLALFAAPGAAEGDRRAAVAAMWPTKSSAVISDVASELRRIDARFTFESTPESQTTSCQGGRWFDSLDGSEGPAFGGMGYSQLAGPTTRYRVTAFLVVDDPGALTPADERAVISAQQRLRALLPSWEGFDVSIAADGFTLDESPLDWTVLSDG